MNKTTHATEVEVRGQTDRSWVTVRVHVDDVCPYASVYARRDPEAHSLSADRVLSVRRLFFDEESPDAETEARSLSFKRSEATRDGARQASAGLLCETEATTRQLDRDVL